MPSPTISLYTISAVVILDADGNRLLAKYYDTESAHFSTLKSQQSFERTLFARTNSSEAMYDQADIAMLDGFVAVFKANLDVTVYVIGSAQQNELLLMSALDTYFEVLAEVLKPQMDKMILLENFEMAALALDEIVDRGIILETEPKDVLAKIVKAPAASSLQSFVEKPLQKQTLSSAFKFAKESVRSFF